MAGKNTWSTFLTFDLLIKVVILHALHARCFNAKHSSSNYALTHKLMLAGNPTESLVQVVKILEAATLGGYKRLRTLVFFARPKDAGLFCKA